MARVGYWFALAVGVVMAALSLKYGDTLHPLLVDALLWGGLAVIAVCGAVALWKGWQRFQRRNVEPSEPPPQRGGTFIKARNSQDISVEDNSSSADTFADVEGVERFSARDNRHDPAGGAAPKRPDHQ